MLIKQTCIFQDQIHYRNGFSRFFLI